MAVSMKVCASVGAAALAFSAVPAAAQYMPHLDPNLYMLTTMNMMGPGSCGPMVEAEIDEARLPAPGIMQAYFDARQAGNPVSSVFKLNGKTSFTHGASSFGELELDAASDPLATPGNALDTDTLRFFRAGTHQTALGQWLVTGPDGNGVGVYTGEFTRESGEWKLHKLTAYAGEEPVGPILHYCSEPGDLDERQVNASETLVAQAERQVERAQRRLERDEADAVEAEARAAEKPDSSGRARRATERRARADERAAELAEAQGKLAEAREKQAEAQAEREEFLALTGPAYLAGQFRLLDDEGKPIAEEATD